MKYEMAPNSLFAILLRSPWWISFAITAGFVVIAKALLPADYFLYGAFGSAPFFVIGCIAAWRQLRAPSAGRIAGTLEAIRAMPWAEFSAAIEDAFRRDGYVVGAHAGSAADFELVKDGRVTLVSCKRWKVARTGIEPLRELRAAQQARDAHDSLYVATGEVTDNARAFAAGNAIRLLGGADLARLLPRISRPSPGASRAARG